MTSERFKRWKKPLTVAFFLLLILASIPTFFLLLWCCVVRSFRSSYIGDTSATKERVSGKWLGAIALLQQLVIFSLTRLQLITDRLR